MTLFMLSMMVAAFPAMDTPETPKPLTETPVPVEITVEQSEQPTETKLQKKESLQELPNDDPRQGFYGYCPPCGRG